MSVAPEHEFYREGQHHTVVERLETMGYSPQDINTIRQTYKRLKEEANDLQIRPIIYPPIEAIPKFARAFHISKSFHRPLKNAGPAGIL